MIPFGRNPAKGHSLVELMVAVAIVGTLAAIGTIDYNLFSIRSKYTRARAELSAVSRVVVGLRIADNVNLIGITGSTCTDCLGNPPSSWLPLGFASVPMDPWGTPYHLDENEMEFGDTDCRRDSLWSSGNDRSFAGLGSGETVGGDDLIVRIPWMTGHNCPQLPDWDVGPSYNY